MLSLKLSSNGPFFFLHIIIIFLKVVYYNMKFIIMPLALFSLLIDERESSLTTPKAGGVDLCKLLLKHEAELFIRDLRYAVGRQFREGEGFWRERNYESQEAFDSEKNQIHESINAFESMIQDVLSRPEKKCAHINAIAHMLARRPLGDLRELIKKGRDKFFVSLGVKLLSLHPEVNLMKYSGIVDQGIRDDVSVLFEIAQKVGLSRKNLVDVLEKLWLKDGRTAFASMVSSMEKFLEESNISEFRLQFPALDYYFHLEGKPALFRLRKAMELFFWKGEMLVHTYRGLETFISDKGSAVIENESLASGMNALSDLLELIAFIPPTERSSRDAAEKAIASMRKAFSADDNSPEQKKHIASVVSTVGQVLPGLKQAAHSSLNGLVGEVLNEINSINVEAKFLIAPLLLSLLAQGVVDSEEYNRFNKPPNLQPQHFAFLKAVLGTSIHILKNRASRSLVALADLLDGFLLEGGLLREDPIEMGNYVLKSAYNFGLKFGIDMLAINPNLLPNFSEKQREKTREIIILFIQFGNEEWNRFRDYLLSSRLASASEDSLENCVNFLDKYNMREQAERLEGVYNDVPLIMPGRFLREYLGIGTVTAGNAMEPSPYSVSVLKVFPLLHRTTILSRSGGRMIPALVSHYEISPFLGLHSKCYDLSQDVSQIYLTHGSFFNWVYPDLIAIARNLPSEILHSAVVDSGENHHSRLLQAANALLGLLYAIIHRGAKIPENSIAIWACPEKLLDHIRLIGSAQSQTVPASMFDTLDLLAQALRDVSSAVDEGRAVKPEICIS